MAAKIVPFTQPSLPVLSDLATRARRIHEHWMVDPLELDAGRLCLSFREYGFDLNWDTETKFLQDVREIKEHAAKLRELEESRRDWR